MTFGKLRSELIISNTYFLFSFFKKNISRPQHLIHIYIILQSERTDVIFAILNKSAKTKVLKKIKTKLKIWKHKLKIVCIAEIYFKRVLGKGALTGESSFFEKKKDFCTFNRMQKCHFFFVSFQTLHRQFTPASLDTMVVAVPPSMR